MRKENQIYFFLMLFLQISCKTVEESPATDSSRILQNTQETDDRELDRTRNLVDIDAQFEFYINRVIAEERVASSIKSSASENEREAFAAMVYKRLGENRPGSGIQFGYKPLSYEIYQVTEVEYWFPQTFTPEANTIVYVDFSDSWYKENPIGLRKGKVWSHMSGKSADHSIAPVIRMRGQLLGADKWGHFFQVGYWLFKSKLERKDRWEMGLFLEGDPLVKNKGVKYRGLINPLCAACAKFGYFGSESTGVVSHADIYAYEFGARFYRELSQDPLRYHFSLASYDLRFLNETFIRSQTSNGVTISPDL